jgi:hypothetical protein
MYFHKLIWSPCVRHYIGSTNKIRNIPNWISQPKVVARQHLLLKIIFLVKSPLDESTYVHMYAWILN